MNVTTLPKPPRVGLVSLGCPKALVDSERIMTKLRADGYDMSPDYAGADVVLVNTCGFLDSAKEESLEAIGEAIAENGRVVVTGCMGKEAEVIRDRFPDVLAVTGPQQYEEVVAAVHEAAPPVPSPFIDLVPEAGLKLTPRHYSYLKISEGCNHRCAFCIIPHLRGDLVSRRPDAILREAEKLVAAGTKELLVISQDTSAPTASTSAISRARGRRGSPRPHDRPRRASSASSAGGDVGATALRLSLPARERRDPADGRGARPPLPRHPVPARQPQRAAAHAPPGERREGAASASATGATRCPISRSARPSWSASPARPTKTSPISSPGSRKRSSTASAPSSSRRSRAPRQPRWMTRFRRTFKQERYEAVMALSARISAEKLAAKVGSTIDVLIDAVDEETGGATGRSKADAPEIDGEVHLRDSGGLQPGDIVSVRVEDSDDHDLYGVPL